MAETGGGLMASPTPVLTKYRCMLSEERKEALANALEVHFLEFKKKPGFAMQVIEFLDLVDVNLETDLSAEPRDMGQELGTKLAILLECMNKDYLPGVGLVPGIVGLKDGRKVQIHLSVIANRKSWLPENRIVKFTYKSYATRNEKDDNQQTEKEDDQNEQQ